MSDVPVLTGTAAQLLADFAADVRYYLALEPKQLPSKYLYDPLGSALFDAITHLPWYPLPRAEARLLMRHGAEIFDRAGPLATIVELGPGSGEKLLMLVQAGRRRPSPLEIRLIDVSPSALARAVGALNVLPGVTVVPSEDTYEAGLERFRTGRPSSGRTLLAFLGSNLGNFDPPGTEALLRNVRGTLRAGDALLLGTDLVKPERDLLLAYDDPLGVTAAFNRNLLVRINRELQADFDLGAFAHRAVWNGDQSRIEMHLVSARTQHVRIAAADFEFTIAAGETIWTESSYKYRAPDVTDLLHRHGFRPLGQWIDKDAPFALTLAAAC